jgi:flagellar basal-body rod protein FlgF
MDRGVYPIVSGAIAQERRMDVVAANLAHIQTVGYKRETAVFRTLLGKPQAGVPKMKINADKVFTREGGTFLDWNGGSFRTTGSPTDVALEGDGFFVVKTPRGVEYTRSGNFVLNATRQLVTREGAPVLGQSGPIQVPVGKLVINTAGDVSVDGAAVDTLRVVKFKDLASAVRVAGQYTTKGRVDPSPNTKVVQGSLEDSNVNAIGELVTMIEINRSYEAAQKVVQAMDDAERQAVTEIGRPA